MKEGQMKLLGKTVLVTGASDGIGRSIAVQLAKQKANLVIFGRDESKLANVKQLCESEGVEVKTYAFDLTDGDKRDEVVADILQTCQIDALVNNAGIWHKASDLTELSEEKIQEVISVNLTSQMLLTRGFLANMRGRETAIINIISSAGMVAKAGRTAYAASKFGLRGFTDALREDTKDEPIRVAAVFQGGTRTQLFAKAGEEMPIEKYTEPDDLADVIVFMLSRPPKIWLNEIQVSY